MQPISKGWISSDISVLQPGKWIQRGDSGVLSEEFGEEVEKCLQVLKLTDCSGKPLESQHHAAIQAIFLQAICITIVKNHAHRSSRFFHPLANGRPRPYK